MAGKQSAGHAGVVHAGDATDEQPTNVESPSDPMQASIAEPHIGNALYACSEFTRVPSRRHLQVQPRRSMSIITSVVAELDVSR